MSKQDEGFREVKIRLEDHRETPKERLLRGIGVVPHGKFCTNEIVTSKYTVLTFLPKNLFEQFSRIANLYFLAIILLQLIPGVSPIQWYSTAAPLMFVMAMTAAKDLWDDVNRHKSDNEINNRKVYVIRASGEKQEAWKDVRVGDILKVDIDDDIPADMIILASSDPDSLCFVETASLDGETNLKLRFAYSGRAKVQLNNPGDVTSVIPADLTIHCELPNAKIYQFDGAVVFADGTKDPLQPMNLALRGCTLRQTDWVVGVVVYSGHDTKVAQNQLPVPRKFTQLEKFINWVILSIFIFMILCCIFLAMGYEIWWQNQYEGIWYIDNQNKWPDYNPSIGAYALQFLRWLLVLYQLIPIGLYVTLEIVKLVQAKVLMDKDRQMYYAPLDTPANCRSTALNEDLGQVKYVLTDKTGTLTQNVMAFVRASVHGAWYGHEIDPSVLKPADEVPEHTPHTICMDPTLRAASNQPKVAKFLTNLAICNTVVPTFKENGLLYQASSPDEEALVQGAAHLGFKLLSRTNELVEVSLQGVLLRYQVLAVLEFSSDRKRMSIICRTPEGGVKLFCKGADSVILARAKREKGTTFQELENHLVEMSDLGLRTLLMSERDIPEAEWIAWSKEFSIASVALTGREDKIAEIAEKIEVNLTILGASGVEDKLQDGVPETLVALVRMGIKVWVLTGDKLETAIAIAHTCGLLHHGVEQLIIGETEMAVPPEHKADGDHSWALKVLEAKMEAAHASHNKPVGLILDGKALAVLLAPELQQQLNALCQKCIAVICCRVSPVQKALVTKMVRHCTKSVTLAIGDGANDVSMIQSAHIGVGISGREGRSAVLASDYSFAQFRFLKRLLLVHGRWNNMRNCILCHYTLYKNCIYVMPFVYYAFVSGFSGTVQFQQIFISTYNAVWTCVPIMVFAILEQDVSAATALNYPEIYHTSQNMNTKLFVRDFWLWMFAALWHSCWCWLPAEFVLPSAAGNGQTFMDIYCVGATVATAVIIIANLKIAMHTHHWTLAMHLSVWLTILVWFPFLAGMSYLFFASPEALYDFFYVGPTLFGDVRYWMIILVCSPAVALLPDILIMGYWRWQKYNDVDILQEVESQMLKTKGVIEYRNQYTPTPEPAAEPYSGTPAAAVQEDKPSPGKPPNLKLPPIAPKHIYLANRPNRVHPELASPSHQRP